MTAFNSLTNLVGSAEFRQYAQQVKDTKVFTFNKTLGFKSMQHSHNLISQLNINEFNSFNTDQWILPFNNTAIVYDDCATVIEDTGKGVYNFITLLYINVETHGLAHAFITGYIDTNKSQELSQVAGHIKEVYIGKEGTRLTNVTSAETQTYFLTCMIQIVKALTEINTLDRFILEISNPNQKTYNSKYVPKLDQRPNYILLYPKEIRKYMGTEHEAAGPRAGHERRAHLRQYPNDIKRFPKAHGKVIQIASTWVGSTEKVVGNKKYRVVLDYYVDARVCTARACMVHSPDVLQ